MPSTFDSSQHISRISRELFLPTERVVVLALSGHGFDMEERAIAAGVDRFVRKPCLSIELVEHLRALLRAREKQDP